MNAGPPSQTKRWPSRPFEGSPYDLKRAVASSVGHFWSFPHSQLYAEPARLAAAGLLEEEREEGGRRRRVFSITRAGRQALAAWLAEPADEQIELRDPGLLRLFFAQHARDEDRRALVRTRLAVHRARLDGYLGLEQRLHGDVGYPRATLRRGIYAEEAAIRFWTELAEDLELVAPRKPVARGRRPGPGASGPRSDDAEPSPPA